MTPAIRSAAAEGNDARVAERAVDRRGARRDLVLILLLALAVRLLRLLTDVEVVERDGAEYCRLAENLLAGRGYVGLIPGPELMFPPLYPLAIAGVVAASGLVPETAGRLVSFLAGLAFVALLHRLLLPSGRRAARIGALVLALLPGPLLASTAVFSESLFLAVAAVVMLALQATLRSGRLRAFAATGASLGLLHLVRAEGAFVAVGMALLLAVTGPQGAVRQRLAGVALLAAAFALVIAPYVVYLREATGSIRVEGKSARVAMAIANYGRGLSVDEAHWGLGEDGREVGSWLDPTFVPDHVGIVGLAIGETELLFSHAGRNLGRVLWLVVSGHSWTSIPLLLLAGFALVRARTERSRLDIHLLLLAAIAIAQTTLYYVLLRFLALLGLATAYWSGRGLDYLLSRRPPSAGRAVVVEVVLVLAFVATASRGYFTGLKEYAEAGSAAAPAKALGRALGDAAAGVSASAAVMSDDARVAYYSGRDWIPLPIAGSFEPILARARGNDVAWLVITLPTRAKGRSPGGWFDPLDPPAGLVPWPGDFGPYRAFRLR